MYRIIKLDGTEIGITDSVNYIKIGESGDFTTATAEDAVGVAFNSIPYNLVNHNDIEGAETVLVSHTDAGAIISELASYTELAAAIREGVNEV